MPFWPRGSTPSSPPSVHQGKGCKLRNLHPHPHPNGIATGTRRSTRSSLSNGPNNLGKDRCDHWPAKIGSIAVPHSRTDSEFSPRQNYLPPKASPATQGRSRRSSPGEGYNSLPRDCFSLCRAKITWIDAPHPPPIQNSHPTKIASRPKRLRPQGRSRRSSPGEGYNSLLGGCCSLRRAKLATIDPHQQSPKIECELLQNSPLPPNASGHAVDRGVLHQAISATTSQETSGTIGRRRSPRLSFGTQFLDSIF